MPRLKMEWQADSLGLQFAAVLVEQLMTKRMVGRRCPDDLHTLRLVELGPVMENIWNCRCECRSVAM